MTFLNQKPTEFKDTLQIPHGKKWENFDKMLSSPYNVQSQSVI